MSPRPGFAGLEDRVPSLLMPPVKRREVQDTPASHFGPPQRMYVKPSQKDSSQTRLSPMTYVGR